MKDNITIPAKPSSEDKSGAETDVTLRDVAISRLWLAVKDGNVAAIRLVLDEPSLGDMRHSEFRELWKKLGDKKREALKSAAQVMADREMGT